MLMSSAVINFPENLPLEIQEKLFDYFSGPAELATLRQVSRSFKHLAEQSWQKQNQQLVIWRDTSPPEGVRVNNKIYRDWRDAIQCIRTTWQLSKRLHTLELGFQSFGGDKEYLTFLGELIRLCDHYPRSIENVKFLFSNALHWDPILHLLNKCSRTLQLVDLSGPLHPLMRPLWSLMQRSATFQQLKLHAHGFAGVQQVIYDEDFAGALQAKSLQLVDLTHTCPVTSRGFARAVASSGGIERLVLNCMEMDLFISELQSIPSEMRHGLSATREIVSVVAERTVERTVIDAEAFVLLFDRLDQFTQQFMSHRIPCRSAVDRTVEIAAQFLRHAQSNSKNDRTQVLKLVIATRFVICSSGYLHDYLRGLDSYVLDWKFPDFVRTESEEPPRTFTRAILSSKNAKYSVELKIQNYTD